MRTPIFELDAVYHVGTMDPARVGTKPRSLEGNCLSVSLCPASWTSIAKLGGNGTFRLSTPGGAFLDAISAREDESLREAIEDWGVSHGLVERSKAWRAWQWDDEVEQWRFLMSPTREEAEAELADLDDADAPEGHDQIEPVGILTALPALAAASGFDMRPGEDALDALMVAWARGGPHGLHLDGVWWDEDHDPLALSSPRGGILPERVPGWVVERVEAMDLDDDDALLATMPATAWVEEAAFRGP